MKKRTKNHLTEEHIRTLREALQGHPREAIITLALVTGARLDELLQMAWKDLDLEKRELRIPNTKTKNGERRISLPEEVIELLKQQHLNAQAEAGADWQDHDLIFPDDVGGPLMPERLLQDWYKILEQAALPRLSSHELRTARGRALYEQIRAAKERSDEEQDSGLSPDKNGDGS